MVKISGELKQMIIDEDVIIIEIFNAYRVAPNQSSIYNRLGGDYQNRELDITNKYDLEGLMLWLLKKSQKRYH